MNRFLSLTLVAALAMGFVACSNDEELLRRTEPEDDGTGAYIQFVVSVPTTTSSSSRADGYTDNETLGVYEHSTKAYLDAESRVHTIYAYFTTDGTNLLQVNEEDASKYYLEFNIFENADGEQDGNGDMYWTTVRKRVDGKLLTLLSEGDDVYTPCDVYVLCNKPVDGVKRVKDLLINTFTFNKNSGDVSTLTSEGMPMAARSMDGVIYQTLKLTKANTYSNPYPLNYEIERAFARISFSGTNSIPLYLTASDPTDGDHTNTSSVKDDEKIGSIKLLGYYVVNKANEYYTYRHVGSINEDFETTFATGEMSNGYPAQYGPLSDDQNAPFLIEPNTSNKTDTETFATGYWNMYGWAFDHLSEFKSCVKLDESGNDSGDYSGVEYVAENTMGNAAQLKTHATGIIFKAKLVPNVVYVVNADGTAIEAASNYSGNLYFINNTFYGSQAAVTLAGLDYLNAKVYKDGIAYYEYFIRHNNNYLYTEMDDLEFAIVRNNSYTLDIIAAAMSPYNSLYNGKPSYDDPNKDTSDGTNPTETDPSFPDPNTPTPVESPKENDTSLKINITVRPWTQHNYSTGLQQMTSGSSTSSSN
jgi:hypothetical protein